MAYTCHSLSTTWEFWKYEIPLVAFEFRHVLDALLALTALSASRQRPRYWSTLDGRMVSAEEGEFATPLSDAPLNTGWKQADRARRSMIEQAGADSMVLRSTDPNGDMLEISRRYFSMALEGHQKALANLNVKNFRATYISSVMVSYYSFFTLSESAEGGDSLMLDPMKWFRLSKGTVYIIDQWKEAVGERWFLEAGGTYGEPDLSDGDELFRPIHYEPFKYLLEPVHGDVIAEEDRIAYEHSLSYIGLMYKGIVQQTESPLATHRRVLAFPARVPDRFAQLVEAHQPRAIAFLAHVLASIKLAEPRSSWFRGIAQRQVPLICMALPPSWSEMVQWPLQIIREDNISPNMPS
ncbi:hypothetical protein M409DRAFT_26461 [Zasmidium cellare ATCC 36951]|uniref:Uncharacterized protein n=1 Tax=Zasmidium cellare ATCC 36951 TaxID=1080233 RepID=A0A6A6C7E7_ZASCE|nr:uncharacterized protein M409DRAFT_26461 [Zasmidium cellare ATCC 36951]KAF2163014.1 hypothetical protein M409DRAFT_26461 [Zasmidium cellare ATCC 36951]